MARSEPSVDDDGTIMVIRPPFGREGIVAVVLVVGGIIGLGVVGGGRLTVVGALAGLLLLGSVLVGGVGLLGFARGSGRVVLDRAAGEIRVGGRPAAALGDLVAVDAEVRMAMGPTGGASERGRVIFDLGSRRLLVADRLDGAGAVTLASAIGAGLPIEVRLPEDP